LDTFIIRPLLVPSIISLFGWFNYFPNCLPEETKDEYDDFDEVETEVEIKKIKNENVNKNDFSLNIKNSEIEIIN
jgi:uncharacterized membrane protein YdfJ with MMPL/SSD domain